MPFASNVSIATDEGFIRLTSSGRKSCAETHIAKANVNADIFRIFLTIGIGRKSNRIIIALDTSDKQFGVCDFAAPTNGIRI